MFENSTRRVRRAEAPWPAQNVCDSAERHRYSWEGQPACHRAGGERIDPFSVVGSMFVRALYRIWATISSKNNSCIAKVVLQPDRPGSTDHWGLCLLKYPAKSTINSTTTNHRFMTVPNGSRIDRVDPMDRHLGRMEDRYGSLVDHTEEITLKDWESR